MTARIPAAGFLTLLLAACAGTTGTTETRNADAFPSRPVHLIEPFGAGGGPDLVARALASKLAENWGQPVTVENLPGAGATAGPAKVAGSPADGYTLLVNTSAQAYSAAVMTLTYDPLKDFIPVAPLSSQPYVLVAGKSANVTSVAELVQVAKARPGELRFGSTGIGTGTHLGIEKFNLAAGIKAVHVPAQPGEGIADVTARTIEGQTDYMMAPISYALPRIHDGSLVALGVSTLHRSSMLPTVPTIAEAGVAGYDHPIWYGVWTPAGTPASVVERLAKDIARAIATAELHDWLVQHDAEPMRMTPAEFAGFVQKESEVARVIFAAAGVRPIRPQM